VVAVGTDYVNTYDTTDGNVDWTKVKGRVTKLVKTTSAYQQNVIGIVSDNHGDFTSAGYNIKDADNPMPIALNGRVPVNIASDSQAIQPGDFLTTSNTEPGKAMKATGAGEVIAKALESWDPSSGTQSVMAYVEQGFYDGESVHDLAGLDINTDSEPQALARNILQNLMDTPVDQSLAVSDITTGTLVAGLQVITPSLVSGSVSTDTITPATGNSVALVLGSDGKLTVSSDSSSEPTMTIDSLGNATFSGTVSAKEIQVGDIAGIQSITNQINQLSQGQEAFTLTASAMNALAGTVAQNQTSIAGLQTDLGSLTDRVSSLEDLLAANAFDGLDSVSTGALQVSGDSSYAGQSEFNGLTFFNDDASFANSVTFNQQTEFKLPPIFNNDTAGFALVHEGDRDVAITFPDEYATMPVVTADITFEATDNIDDTSADQLFSAGIQYIVKNKNSKGFTILLNKPAPRNIRFSWIALGVRDPNIYESIVDGLSITPPQTADTIVPQTTAPDGAVSDVSAPVTSAPDAGTDTTTPAPDTSSTSSGDTSAPTDTSADTSATDSGSAMTDTSSDTIPAAPAPDTSADSASDTSSVTSDSSTPATDTSAPAADSSSSSADSAPASSEGSQTPPAQP
jgi:hypothetical protein